MSALFTEVAGQKLNGEQTSYLDGFFAGLRNRGFSFADVEAAPASARANGHAPAPATPDLGDLIPEERLKRESHPLDAYPLLLQHAAANQAPDKENTFRFKWHGLFYLAPHKEGFMARLRIPGGQLKTFQLRELAHVAQQLTRGYVQITTRANIQMRLIQPKDAPEVLRRIQSVGLHTRGSGADNIRNLTCNPTAGIDPGELVARLHRGALGHLELGHRSADAGAGDGQGAALDLAEDGLELRLLLEEDGDLAGHRGRKGSADQEHEGGEKCALH